MKLNIDCVRDVLLAAESCKYNNSLRFDDLVSTIPNYSSDDIAYTCLKLQEANYLKLVSKTEGNNVRIVKITDISFQGHEFLNNIRSDSVWSKTKTVLGEIGIASLSGTVQIASGVVSAIIKAHLGLP